MLKNEKYAVGNKMSKTEITETLFLTNLYTNDPLISNTDALKLLKIKFPHTQTKNLSTWKYLLRLRGLKIPHQKTLPRKET